MRPALCVPGLVRRSNPLLLANPLRPQQRLLAPPQCAAAHADPEPPKPPTHHVDDTGQRAPQRPTLPRQASPKLDPLTTWPHEPANWPHGHAHRQSAPTGGIACRSPPRPGPGARLVHGRPSDRRARIAPGDCGQSSLALPAHAGSTHAASGAPEARNPSCARAIPRASTPLASVPSRPNPVADVASSSGHMSDLELMTPLGLEPNCTQSSPVREVLLSGLLRLRLRPRAGHWRDGEWSSRSRTLRRSSGCR